MLLLNDHRHYHVSFYNLWAEYTARHHMLPLLLC